MELPNYFLADLPTEATLTPAIVTEACQTLKSNRRRFLAERSVATIVSALASVARDWLDARSPFRQQALEHGPARTGFSSATLAAGLDAFFSGLTEEHLNALVLQDLGRLDRLEAFGAIEAEEFGKRAALARGPELVFHVAGGVIPNAVFSSLILGLLARSSQFVKCAMGASYLPRLFAHSIHAREPKLAACLELAEWKGGLEAVEGVLFQQADCVTATGSDETLALIRSRVPIATRFAAYGHRVSFGYVTREGLSGLDPRAVAAKAAQDVAAWDQQGCLSPHLFYVETGGRVAPEAFAELLAGELAACEQRQPRGPLPPQASAAVATRRSFYGVRAAHSSDTLLWASQGSTAWTVVFENDPAFQSSCLNRFVYVKPVTDLEQALQGADRVRGQVSTVGLEATDIQARNIVMALARWGATRICRLGNMQNPPLSWRHDGGPSLGQLLTWTDWEK